MRQLSRYDNDILEGLRHLWGSCVKIDRDVLNEPCIFHEINGLWELTYKLSFDGSYTRNCDYYVRMANDAIISRYEADYEIKLQKKKNDAIARQSQEDFKIAQEHFAKHGFKDNLPEEGEE